MLLKRTVPSDKKHFLGILHPTPGVGWAQVVAKRPRIGGSRKLNFLKSLLLKILLLHIDMWPRNTHEKIH